jgi:hypothetical protein
MSKLSWVVVLSVVFAAGCRTGGSAATLRAVDDGAAAADDDRLLPPYEPKALVVVVNEATAKGPAPAAAPTAGLGLADGAGQPDSYDMTVFGYQGRGPLNLPRNAHSFAVFAHAKGAALATAALEVFTISWMPADNVAQLGQGVKAGRNFAFAESMANVQNGGLDIRRSPLVKIDPQLYARALRQYHLLKAATTTGAILYKLLDDVGGRSAVVQGVPGGYTNCIHALSDMMGAAGGGLLDTGLKHGFAASDIIFAYLSGFGAVPGVAYDAALAGRLSI